MTHRALESMQHMLDPTGGTGSKSGVALAPRLATLRGTTVGLLDNGKANGSLLLSDIGTSLQQKYVVREVIPYTKGHFSKPVEQTQMERILATCDFAVTAIGD